MNFEAQREVILKPLQAVIGVVERRQTMPILANILMVVKDGKVSLTATDLEVELVASAEVAAKQDGEITVPGRKFLDICRALPEGAKISFESSGERATVRSGRSRFTLSTLAATEFPSVEEINAQQTVGLAQKDVKKLLEKTHFAMAHQDVRYYLNGLLLEMEEKILRGVATDGHRLAMCELSLEGGPSGHQQVIVPRKGVLELQRLLAEEGGVELVIGTNHVRAQLGNIRFTSKLVDGRFPEYGRVIPEDTANTVQADKGSLKQALNRAAILSNEKYRGIRLDLKENAVTIQAHNPEREEAEEHLEVNYGGDELEIGFNVNYLLDALGAVEGEDVAIGVSDSNSSCLIEAPGDATCKYVVMPMRL